jgi:hypothetical protein
LMPGAGPPATRMASFFRWVIGKGLRGRAAEGAAWAGGSRQPGIFAGAAGSGNSAAARPYRPGISLTASV